MSTDRRRFDRLPLHEDAVAIDAAGRRLGRVVHVSGGGMQIECGASVIASSLAPGQRLRITVLEPASNVSNTVDAEVKHVDGMMVGLEFVSPT
jgi:hypothetical protein